jgi:hypothetical protein
MAEGTVLERQVSVAAQSCQDASEESKKHVEHGGRGLDANFENVKDFEPDEVFTTHRCVDKRHEVPKYSRALFR